MNRNGKIARNAFSFIGCSSRPDDDADGGIGCSRKRIGEGHARRFETAALVHPTG